MKAGGPVVANFDDDAVMRQCMEAGANAFVAGSSTFKAPDMAAAIQSIREA